MKLHEGSSDCRIRGFWETRVPRCLRGARVIAQSLRVISVQWKECGEIISIANELTLSSRPSGRTDGGSFMGSDRLTRLSSAA